VQDYTPPDRAQPALLSDLITRACSRQLLADEAPPTTYPSWVFYTHCTHQEDAARKVERRLRVRSRAAAAIAHWSALDGIVTGTAAEGV
jgi:hypothetical protein